MWKPPWWWWLQPRDIVPVLICTLILIGFLYLVARGSALAIVAVMHHIRHALHHP
jgi:hypothetical protein